jgi:hypothetical protein
MAQNGMAKWYGLQGLIIIIIINNGTQPWQSVCDAHVNMPTLRLLINL